MNTKRKFESKLHRELYKEMLMLVRKDSKKPNRLLVPKNTKASKVDDLIVIYPPKENTAHYAWLIFSGLLLLGYGMFHLMVVEGTK